MSKRWSVSYGILSGFGSVGQKSSTLGFSLLICAMLAAVSMSAAFCALLRENQVISDLSNSFGSAKTENESNLIALPVKKTSSREGAGAEKLFPLRKSTVESVLTLHADVSLVCDKLMYVRVPKTGSSSLSYNIFLRLQRVGKACNSSLYRLPRTGADVSYTATEDILARSMEPKHNVFVGHMDYTTGLAKLMRADDGYKLTSVRAPYDRYTSWLNYEMARGRNMSTASFFSQLNYISREKAELTDFSNNTRVHEMVASALLDFDTIVVAEKFDFALSVLMYDLKWRLGDLLSVSINTRPATASSIDRRAVFSQVSEDVKAVFDADEQLYKMAAVELDRRFDALPELYRKIPAVLDLLRAHMAAVCRTSSASQVHSNKQSNCIQELRQQVIDQPEQIVEDVMARQGTMGHALLRMENRGEDVTQLLDFREE